VTDPGSLDLNVVREHEVPVGTQLVWKLRAMISAGRLAPGERLPSVRQLADAAGVNVNTVRAVYRRLEDQGLVSSEQGRGTFVAVEDRLAPGHPSGGLPATPTLERAARRELRRQIAELEAELVRHPQALAEQGRAVDAPESKGNLLTTQELQEVRDELLARLEQLEAARADVLQRLEALDEVEARAGVEPAEALEPQRHSTSSLGAVRVRWVGTT
jgi:DNA-binding transcriptional regulator YhcF (GntR family)